MNLISGLKKTVLDSKNRLKDNNFDSLLWFINIFPYFCGFSYKKDKITAWFWVLHFTLLFYVYVVGILWYQWKFAQGAADLIKGYVNIAIVIIIGNNSWWFVKQRPLLREVLKKIYLNDQVSLRSSFLRKEHEKLMQIIKWMIFFYYGFNYIDVFFVYLPHRVDILNNYSMIPCVGLEPITASPNREVCLTILALQELTIMIVALNYQSLLLFLIAHTGAMYQMMSYEMMAVHDKNKKINRTLIKKRLSTLIERHSLNLKIVDKLKSLYSVPLGVNFGTSAVCISLLFALPLQEWLQFMPVLVYCLFVFFLYCFLCQRLINASEDFERSVYCCGWENFDLREKKMVYIMLRQAQKPVVLLAAGIVPVNIPTFATTFQAMFKFVTVVKF